MDLQGIILIYDRETQIAYDFTYVWNHQKPTNKTEIVLMIERTQRTSNSARRKGHEKMGSQGRGLEVPVTKQISHGVIRYDIGNTVNNITISLYNGWVYQTQMLTRLIMSDHFIMYKSIKSLCCIPEKNTILYANYTSFF